MFPARAVIFQLLDRSPTFDRGDRTQRDVQLDLLRLMLGGRLGAGRAQGFGYRVDRRGQGRYPLSAPGPSRPFQRRTRFDRICRSTLFPAQPAKRAGQGRVARILAPMEEDVGDVQVGRSRSTVLIGTRVLPFIGPVGVILIMIVAVSMMPPSTGRGRRVVVSHVGGKG